MTNFDISLAFDKSKYLDAQIYMLVDTLKDKLPNDTTTHIITNRSRKSQLIKHIKDNFQTKVYHKPKTDDLISRCRYLLNAVEAETDAGYLIRMFHYYPPSEASGMGSKSE